MTKSDKLLLRLLSRPKDFTYIELKNVLSSLGYFEKQGSGSRVSFISHNHRIKLHKPHPGNIMKRYQINLIIEELKKFRII